jgi:hypothetical protein
MKSIAEIISPIMLLEGSHKDTGSTGQGCFMNVVAYLNGEVQITDDSPCVCITVKQIIIWFNDFLNQNERQELIPFIDRAMGSASFDRDIINKRIGLVVEFSKDVSKIASAVSGGTDDTAYVTDPMNRGHVVVVRAAFAGDAAASKAIDRPCRPTWSMATYLDFREQIKAATFKFLDSALPKSRDADDVIIARAKELVALSA